jgi:hypothetical protein
MCIIMIYAIPRMLLVCIPMYMNTYTHMAADASVFCLLCMPTYVYILCIHTIYDLRAKVSCVTVTKAPHAGQTQKPVIITFNYTSKQVLRCSGCGSSCTHLSTASGTISDGSNSYQYGANSNCTWLIAPPIPPTGTIAHESLMLTFEEFDVEEGFDFVDVFACTKQYCLDAEDQTALGHLTGSEAVGRTFLTASSFLVTFVSDETGQYQGFTAKWRIRCQAGWYLQEQTSLCLSCSQGTFSTVVGSVSSADCTPCPPGTYSTTSGANSSLFCTPCPPSWYSTENSSTACTECLPGSYSPDPGGNSSILCVPCPPGTYAIGLGTSGSVCTKCLSGKYSSDIGANSSSTCALCWPGTYSPSMGANSSVMCLDCGAGTYSNTYEPSVCQRCSAGSYSAVVGATVCLECPEGTYSGKLGVSACNLCPPGTFSVVMGAKVVAVCKYCLNGTFSLEYGANSSATCSQVRSSTTKTKIIV